MFKRILVPVDGTAHSNRAVKMAAGLARRERGAIAIFHASPAYHIPYAMEGYSVEWPSQAEYGRAAAKGAQKVFKAAAKWAGRVPVTTLHDCTDDPASAILAAARKSKADAIVMMSHGRTGLDRMLLGSQTQKVVTRARQPVIVVK